MILGAEATTHRSGWLSRAPFQPSFRYPCFGTFVPWTQQQFQERHGSSTSFWRSTRIMSHPGEGDRAPISTTSGEDDSPAAINQSDPRENDVINHRACILPELIPLDQGEQIQMIHGFSERANWLVPGRVLLGKYPGQIPADFPTEWQTARDRVKEVIMRGGVTDLLSLQAELPPQADEAQWNEPTLECDSGVFFSGFRSYRGDALAAASAALESSRANDDMESVDYSDEVAPRQGSDLTFHHFPIPDLSPAENMGLMSGLVNDLESLIMQKKVLFIHCWAGRGRTGLIAACLLGKLYPNVTAEQSLTRVDVYYRTRGTVAIGKTSRISPETEGQEEQVRLFFETVLRR